MGCIFLEVILRIVGKFALNEITDDFFFRPICEIVRRFCLMKIPAKF